MEAENLEQQPQSQPQPEEIGTVSSESKHAESRTQKGRGFEPTSTAESVEEEEDGPSAQQYESIANTVPTPSSFLGNASAGGGSGRQRSIEGWLLLVTNIHPEAQEDDIYDLFADYGEIRQTELNLDRRTGFVKGYALVEFVNEKEAERAVKDLNGKKMFDRTIAVDWAFTSRPRSGAKMPPRTSAARKR